MSKYTHLEETERIAGWRWVNVAGYPTPLLGAVHEYDGRVFLLVETDDDPTPHLTMNQRNIPEYEWPGVSNFIHYETPDLEAKLRQATGHPRQ